MLKKHRKNCLEKKPCVLTNPKQDLFAINDTYQKVPYYFFVIADFECVNEMIYNIIIDRKTTIFLKKTAGSWGLKKNSEPEDPSKSKIVTKVTLDSL